VLLIRLLLALALLSAGCSAGRSQFVPGEPSRDDAIRLAAPAETVVLIYNHGSEQEFIRDPCEPARGDSSEWSVPSVLSNLSGTRVAGKVIVVYGYCTPSRVGEYLHAERSGEPKVVKRAREIAILADRFAALGVPRRQIFLAGHSAGAWASLLVAREGPGWFNAVVGFGPAFAGRRASRPPGWQWLRGTQVLHLSAATRIDALIFAFEGDPYEPPEDLAFLRRIPGVELVVLSGTQIDGVSCGSRSPHLTDRKPCFHATQGARIRDYIERRLHPAER
jgi:predicted esterase